MFHPETLALFHRGQRGAETLLLFDCPRNDFHAALTDNDIIAFMTAAVRERLQV